MTDIDYYVSDSIMSIVQAGVSLAEVCSLTTDKLHGTYRNVIKNTRQRVSGIFSEVAPYYTRGSYQMLTED